MRGTLIVCAEVAELWREAARRIVAAIHQHSEERFTLALSGGSTPRPLYELLASEEWRGRIPWTKLHLFWSDERLVPLDHPESNYRMAREALLRHVPVPAENIHSVPVHLAIEEAAQQYEREIRTFFRVRRGPPAFDLILLGLGADGHTASLFPGSPALAELQRWVAPVRSAKAMPRVTLTVPVLNQARRLFFLAVGEEKAAALEQASTGRDDGCPAARVAPRKGELIWLVDRAAASRLTRVRVEG